MPRSMDDSLSLLSESLTNCKSALTAQGVSEVDDIKVSDVDEKIAEISAGTFTVISTQEVQEGLEEGYGGV